MKTIVASLALIVFGVLPAAAQGYAPGEGPENDPELQAARPTAEAFVELLYSGKYKAAEEMMNPNPPHYKPPRSEFRKSRIASIERHMERRKEYGPPTSRVISSQGISSMSERPPSEKFYQFYFKSTFADGRTAYEAILIIEKDGNYYVERLM